MKVTVTSSFITSRGVSSIGDVIELDDELVGEYTDAGMVKPIPTPKVKETADAPKPVEKAVAPEGK